MDRINDTATVTLQVNGKQAKQMMAEVETKIQETKDKIEKLKASMASPKEIEKAKKQLRSYEKQLDEMKSSTKGVKKALENMDKATPRQLEKALRTLNRQLKDMVPGSEVWDSHIEKIKELKQRLSEIKDETNGVAGIWGRFKRWAEDTWPAIDLISRGYNAVVSGFRQYVDAYASMDQEMANVRKYTGMSEEQVISLNEAFKKIDTRTSREQLNMLAQEAGRLGKTTEEDVLGYVRAADKINVALEDLGTGATLTLSKLTGIFGLETEYGTEQSLLKVGSVVNELSQNCSASAPYLTEFTNRMGGVGAQAGMTVDQIMAFGAVLDSNAQKVEASATAVSQVLVRMMQDPAKYARVAGLEVESFAEKLSKDANGALLEFLDALNKAGNMDVLSPMFKDMGESGARAITALSTLAKHIDEVKAQQEAANEAFREGISIDNEFAVQNNTVEASLEKCKNRANELRVELGQHLYPLMKHFLTTGSALLRVLILVVKFVAEHKAGIMALTGAISAYLIVVNKEILIKKIRNTLDTIHYGYLLLESKATKALAVVTESLRLVYYRWTGQTMKAVAAQNALRVAMASTPWGAILAALSTAVGAFMLFNKSAKEASTSLEILNEGKAKANAKLTEEKILLQQNLTALENFNGTRDAEIELVNKLNEKYGDFFGNCQTVKEWYEKLSQGGTDYCNVLYKQILLEAKRQQALDLIQDAENLRQEANGPISVSNGSILQRWSENFNSTVQGFVEGLVNGEWNWNYDSDDEAFEELVAERVRDLNKQADAREAQARALLDDIVNDESSRQPFVYKPTPTNQSTDPTIGRDRFAVEKAARDRAEAEARISYAKGDSDYEEFTARMDEIAVNYFNLLLQRTDLSKTEELSILAQKWEAINKQTKHATEALLKEENSYYDEAMASLKEYYTRKLENGNLSAKEREQLEKTYQEALELSELEHLKNLRDMTTEGTEERLKAEQKYLDARLKATKRHQDEYERKQREHEAKLASIKDKYFGHNATENTEAFNTDMAALTEVYNAEIAAAGDNEAEILRIKEAYMAAELALRKQYNQEGAEDSKSAYSAAIQSAVDWLQSEGGQALTGSLSTVVSGMSSIFSGLSTMIQAELDIQTAQIEKRYDREIQLAQGNSYKIAQAEKKKETEIAKAKNEANKKMFAMQVIQAVAQTAQNALAAYGSAAQVPVVGYILAPIAAAMAVAAGAIQIAAIKKQQQASEAQGYSQGGFTKKGRVDEPAGIVHAGEWVASQKLLANPVARPMIEALDYAQRTNTIGRLRAEDVSRSITANNSLVRIAESDNGSMLMVAVSARMATAVDNLTSRLNEPFVTVNTVSGDYGIKSVQDDYAKLIRNKSPKSKK